MKKLKKEAPVAVASPVKRGLPLGGVVGFLLLLVGLSTAFADYLVIFGTSDMISKYLLIPNITFWLALGIYKSMK